MTAELLALVAGSIRQAGSSRLLVDLLDYDAASVASFSLAQTLTRRKGHWHCPDEVLVVAAYFVA